MLSHFNHLKPKGEMRIGIAEAGMKMRHTIGRLYALCSFGGYASIQHKQHKLICYDNQYLTKCNLTFIMTQIMVPSKFIRRTLIKRDTAFM